MPPARIIKIPPTPDQAACRLTITTKRFDTAENAMAATAFRHRTASPGKPCHLTCREIRKRLGLSAPMAVRTKAKAAEAYKRDKAVQPVVLANPSGTRPYRGVIDKRNRPNQASFRCIGDGFTGPADTIARQHYLQGRCQPTARGTSARGTGHLDPLGRGRR